MFSLCDLFDDIPELHIVDVGASPIEGDPVYLPVVNRGNCRLTGFEPNPSMYAQLMQKQSPHQTFLPYALGDGNQATLHICASPGMSSLLEPDMELLSHFHAFGEWSKVIETQPLTTHRMDDLDELQNIDFLKLDVQGSEFAILQNASRKLQDTLVVHVETLFVLFYKNQPLFGEIDLCLRKAGFLFHRFGELVSRTFQPLLVNNDPYKGLSQVLWSDATYVKDFTRFKNLSPADLLKTARIMHDIYSSTDMVYLLLGHVDGKTGSHRQAAYLKKLQTQ